VLRSTAEPNRRACVVASLQRHPCHGNTALLEELARRPEVEKVVADRAYDLPSIEPGQAEVSILAVEWGIDRIRAPLVWSNFGVRGEGIVVANIDSGVRYDHPALVRQYRGNLGNGTFNHNYNWFDPTNVCVGDSPCDNTGRGTHTMGTIAGDDGGGNQIGVAPAVRWIGAKGCETNSCSTAPLLAAGQWVLAPTDLNGQNPRPDLAADIVNNSWFINDGADTFFVWDGWCGGQLLRQLCHWRLRYQQRHRFLLEPRPGARGRRWSPQAKHCRPGREHPIGLE
jgi:subtilisin family serine protease